MAHGRRPNPTLPRFTERIARILKTNMPPKRRRASNEDEVDPQDTLDEDHFKAAQGGDLHTLHWEVEAKLPHARRAERVRARSELLAQVLRPEPIRQICRRAGIKSYTTSAPDGEDTVLSTLQKVADVFLFNIAFEINRLCAHLKKKTVTDVVLREAFKSFGEKMLGSCEGRHETCRTLRRHRESTGEDDMRGADADIDHERNIGEICVYFANAPFVKLLRLYMQEQATFQHPIQVTAGVVSCIQLTLEQTLIELLEKARYLVRQTTKKSPVTAHLPGVHSLLEIFIQFWSFSRISIHS